MTEGWVKVYTSADFFKSELVRQLLTENEIEAVILNKQGYPYNIGQVEVYVQPNLAQQATDIIEQNEI